MHGIHDPTQLRKLDHVTLRREMKGALAGDLVLDTQEERELLDLSNQHARYNVLRIALLRAALYGAPRPRTLTPQEWQALASYLMGGGHRPAFARYVTADGHYHGASLDPEGAAARIRSRTEPKPDPHEPGRYVQPKGEFAIPGDRP